MPTYENALDKAMADIATLTKRIEKGENMSIVEMAKLMDQVTTLKERVKDLEAGFKIDTEEIVGLDHRIDELLADRARVKPLVGLIAEYLEDQKYMSHGWVKRFGDAFAEYESGLDDLKEGEKV